MRTSLVTSYQMINKISKYIEIYHESEIHWFKLKIDLRNMNMPQWIDKILTGST